MPQKSLGYVRVEDLLNYMRGFNFDTERLLEKAGISEKALCDFKALDAVPPHIFAHLFHVCTAELPNHIRDGAWAGGFTSRSFRLVAYAMVASKDLRTALQRAHEFHELIASHHSRVSISSHHGKVRLTYIPATHNLNHDNPVSPGLSLWYSVLSWMIGQHIPLDEVTLTQPINDATHRQLLRLLQVTKVAIKEDSDYFEFPERFLDAPLVISTRELDRFLEYSPHEPMLLAPKPATAKEQIRSLIGQDFSRGLPSFEQLAERLGFSVSGLRRRLLREGSSYREIKEQARKETALQLLAETELPIGTIAEQSGFSEQGSFSRVFKQWMGMSPQQYRQRAQSS